jgi:hypothetical protein
MRQSEKDLLCQYIYNNYCRLEQELDQMQTNLRFRRFDIADLVELICARQQFDTFKEVTGHIRLLLKLDKVGDSDENTKSK